MRCLEKGKKVLKGDIKVIEIDYTIKFCYSQLSEKNEMGIKSYFWPKTININFFKYWQMFFSFFAAVECRKKTLYDWYITQYSEH
jgi:hypothetical protein